MNLRTRLLLLLSCVLVLAVVSLGLPLALSLAWAITNAWPGPPMMALPAGARR